MLTASWLLASASSWSCGRAQPPQRCLRDGIGRSSAVSGMPPPPTPRGSCSMDSSFCDFHRVLGADWLRGSGTAQLRAGQGGNARSSGTPGLFWRTFE
uniref:Putative secreted protein n=1 Tax=Ixodes ricinus TaxID=34613 RepID=A0A6B0U537_IXORI